MNVTDNQKLIIKEHALEENPKECCGLILLNEEVVKLKNKSYFPLEAFVINFEDLPDDIELSDIKGFYHSHPQGGKKSSLDVYFSHKVNLPFAIYNIPGDSFSTYSPNGYYELPLVGRDFLANEIDCITLVKDYFKRNLNIEVEDIKHPIREVEPDAWQNHPEFWKYNKKDNMAFVELYKERGFSVVSDLKKNDIVLSDNGLVKALSHVGVYVGNDKIIHHPYPTRSIIDSFQNFKENSKIMYMRHKLFVK